VIRERVAGNILDRMGESVSSVAAAPPRGVEGRVDAGVERGRLEIADLVKDHADFIWRTLRRLGVPEASVDDATQRVFLITTGKLGDIQRGKERSFLFGIAMNVAAHARRGLARSREVPYDSERDLVVADPNERPDELLDRQRARAILDEILDALPDELRATFVLFELEGLTVTEIGELTQVPRGTAASRLRRAREEFLVVAERVRRRRGEGRSR
jgi:RNA polymerase sigma-70 factor, ECF subfamily